MLSTCANRLPTKALGGRVPMQQLTGSMPDLTHLRMYGCKAFVKVDDAARKSLDSKAREAVNILVTVIFPTLFVCLFAAPRAAGT